jgi:hypothetical protein
LVVDGTRVWENKGEGEDCHVIPGRKFEAHRDSKFPINQILRGDNRILNRLDIFFFSFCPYLSIFCVSRLIYRLLLWCDTGKCISLGKLEFATRAMRGDRENWSPTLVLKCSLNAWQMEFIQRPDINFAEVRPFYKHRAQSQGSLRFSTATARHWYLMDSK